MTRMKNSNPDPYFQPLNHEIEGVADKEPIEENVADDHEDTNDNPADQGEEVNEANEDENKKGKLSPDSSRWSRY